ncbi:TM2 domain-containing protein [Deinococcus marmoris]|uniref:TM2 domain-containing protein n=2 Tax=Deinococcus marmoris TaxID=249408 RepID=UPI0004963DFB|nr:NINE protein [Deinococcus marmoris]
MTNPDDQKTPAAGRAQGNAPSWVDDVLGTPGSGSGSSGQTHAPDSTRPNLSKTPPPAGDLRIPEPARAAPAPAAETDDWISRVTGSPPPARPNAPHTAPQPSSPRPTAPDLDAWGEPQRPTIRVADERPITPYAPAPTHAGDVAQKRLIAGLLAIFLGSLGVHKFYLGMNTQGILILGANIGVWVLALLIGLLTLGFGLFITLPLAGVVSSALGLLGLVEGILYLTKSDADFGRDYLVGKKPWL